MALARTAASVAKRLRGRTGLFLPIVRPVFVHIPKTGGSSIGRMLTTAYWGQPQLVVSTTADREQAFAMPQEAFDRFAVYRGHFGPELATRVRSPFVFTFLRDPLDALLSNYSYARSLGRMTVSLDAFLERDDAFNMMTRALCSRCSADDAIAALERMNFVGLTEHFAEDAQNLFRLLGRRYVAPARANVTAERIHVHDLSPQQLQAAMRATEHDRRVYEWARDRRKDAGVSSVA